MNQCADKTQSGYALAYGNMSKRTFMHESGHNLGAVPNSAPNSSGAAHCNDGMDIMCYADGGYKSDYRRTACTDREHFDCNHDDYFHPDPAPGTYLYENWNVGSCLNDFLTSSRCNKAPVVAAGADSVCLLLVECSGGAGRTQDVDGDVVSWRWSFASCPQDLCPALSQHQGTFYGEQNTDVSVPPARFTPTRSGNYTLTLTVTDAQGNVGGDERVVSVP